MCQVLYSDPAWTTPVIFEGSLGGSLTGSPILQMGVLGMEARVAQGHPAGLPTRQPGSPVDSLNYVLEEMSFGNLNWNSLVHPTT